MSYYRRIVLVFLLAAVAAVAVASAFFQHAFEQAALRRLESSQGAVANELSKDIEGVLDSARRDIEFLAAHSAFRSLPHAQDIDRTINGIPEHLDRAKRDLLETLHSKDRRFSVLFVLTPEGDHYISHPFAVQRSLKKFNLSDRPYFREAVTSRATVISDRFLGADGIPAVALDTPVFGPDGAIVAHVGGVAHLDILSRWMAPGHMAPFQTGFLIDRQGQLIAHTDPAFLNTGLDDRYAGYAKACAGWNEAGGESLVHLHPLAAGWCFGLIADRSAVLGEVRAQALSTSAVAGTLILLVTGLGILAVARLGRRGALSEAALKESEERYRTLFDTAPDAVLVHQDGRIRFANPALADLLGAPAAEALVGREMTDIVHPDFRAAIAGRIQEAEKDSSADSATEQKLLAVNGEPIDVEVTGRRITVNGRPAAMVVLHDIRERKRIQAERDRFFEISLDLLSIADTHGYFRRLTPRWTEVLGWSVEEMLAKPFLEFIHPDDAPATIDAISRLRENKPILALVNRFRCRNGTYRWLEWTAFPERGETIYAIARDITVRRIHEAEIHRLGRRLDLILRAVGEGLCGLDWDGRITFVNPAAARMLGWDPEAMIGLDMHAVFHHSRPDGSAYALDECPMRQTVLDGKFRHVEDEVLWRRDGTPLPAEYTVTPIEEEGRTIGASVVFRDVGDRREAEAAMQRYNALLECIGRIQGRFIGEYDAHDLFDTLLKDVLTLTGSEFGFVAESCGAPDEPPCLQALAISDVAWDEATRRFFADKGASGFRFTGTEGLHIAAAVTGRPVIANDPARDPRAKGLPDGHPNLGSFMGLPLKRGDTVIGVIGLANRRDGYDETLVDYLDPIVTAAAQIVDAHKMDRLRKAMEADLTLKTNQLESSNAELQSFAYVASHDLQEPLRMVTSYLQLLERRYSEALDDQAHEFISYAVDGARRMQRLIKDLLEYSRVGTRGKPFAETEMERVFGDAMTNLTVAVADAKATVTHDPLPKVWADETQMVSLIQNLVGNAIKYRAPGRDPAIHLHVERTGMEWLFAVRDNGIGIDPKHFQRIFMVFQRLHSRQEYEGTGIGLAVSKKIVERHGGRIWVDSVADGGSTFYFTLPAEHLG
ncbi:MAG: PAS domain S-box protein [Magnetospirillum sp. WYHS-4]